MKLTSPSFQHEGTIPEKYAQEGCGAGENISPPLSFENAPAEAQSFVVMLEDPDAPEGSFTHWIAYDLSAEGQTLEEGAANTSLKQGINTYGTSGYAGPCQPGGQAHRYFFYLYALDVASLEVPEGVNAQGVRSAMEGHVLAQAQLIAGFARGLSRPLQQPA